MLFSHYVGAMNNQRSSFVMEYINDFLGIKYSYEAMKNGIKRSMKSAINSLKIRMAPKLGERFAIDGPT